MPTIRVSDETRDQINELCSLHNMAQEVVIGRLLSENAKHDLFSPGWEKKLAEAEFNNLLQDVDIEFRKKIELDKHRAILKAKMMVFKEYLKTMQPAEKKKFLENVLGDTSGGNFLENLSSYQMFIIDGEKKLYVPDGEGFPVIPGINRDRVVKCDRGFHIKNARCSCRYWRECPIGASQYEDWLSKFGTPKQQKQYLEETTGDKYMLRRDYR